jgi:tetratricopeptide (TPR) repeat protein
MRAVGDRSGEARTLNNIGLVHVSLGEWQKALDFYDRALPLMRAVGDRDGEATMLNNIGSVCESLGEKQKAIVFYTNALSLMHAVGARSGEAITLGNLAYVKRPLGHFDESRTYAESALKIIESVRASVVSKELRSSYFATRISVYEFYVDLLMRLHKQEPARGLTLRRSKSTSAPAHGR